MRSGDGLLLDDFGDPSRAAIGTRWTVFTDRVMGGRSEARAAIVVADGVPVLRLAGEVSLANRGGFIQAALPLEGPEGTPLDASGFAGFRLRVRGEAPGAFLHLRTSDTTLPWEHYAAPIPLSRDWADVAVPFAAFSGRGTGRVLDPARLVRVGLVAGGGAGPARIEVARLALG